MVESETTEFAPAARAAPEMVARQAAHFTGSRIFLQLMDYVPDMVLVLNSERQIVYANKAVLQVTHRPDRALVLGLRPGELFGCKHGHESEAGCGTTRFCSCCGAVKAILQSQSGRSASEECHLNVNEGGGERALDLRVWAWPVTFNKEQFTFFCIADIADEKRRQVLERIFLHDVINTAMALQGLSLLLSTRSPGIPEGEKSHEEHVRRIRALAQEMVDQLEAQRQLISAENGDLKLRIAPVRSLELLEDVSGAYRRNELLKGRRLRIDDASVDIIFESDRRLLSRVLSNMVKNALEASSAGDTATIGCKLDGVRIVFWVHNRTYMPENVRLQIFNRSFSTKGVGRGLGTYSMRFLTDKYLGGTLDFTSSETEGTTFYASYPLILQEPQGGSQDGVNRARS
ncbi:MAG TPA: PAS domain-containing sensor histidine kinase [Terriglobales bacterium]|nr:PAS domain-containing sensor histidine kinase [Terriglobales bacterium]